MAVKKILISQPNPTIISGKSPYEGLIRKNNVTIDFQPFIKVQDIQSSQLRPSQMKIQDHTAILFTTRRSIDAFFRLCKEWRITKLERFKYFCLNQSVALYLQKHILYRKRKVFFGKGNVATLMEKIVPKHLEEKVLIVLPKNHTDEIPNALASQNMQHTIATITETVSNDLTTTDLEQYDLIGLFSPAGVKSLFENFPQYQQDKTIIATFGQYTQMEAEKRGLEVHIKAPTVEHPSMIMAIDAYLSKNK